ncbi:hypothetical protein KFE25_000058 [Diacronema lutheri]|uniref:4-coumarate--CoA ligase n=1 Tax=Diacronema lutheri TaxID=2081491 RepID=A0A8J5XII0_DIALT|nr:hypothetical protein KFE25_000058 [Diacronema lutheri]|mmetsp:Transcript_5824/g.18323  ORF Transcript_5824/g.18323 Transcript_5824/m.18323 type:complete len:605 (-) Transcript_5824:163-1977(-)
MRAAVVGLTATFRRAARWAPLRRVNASALTRAGVTRSPYPPIEPLDVGIADLATSEWPRFSAEGRVAVIDEAGKARTFAELSHDVSHIAGALSARGIGPGDVVAIVSPNHIDYGAVALAVLRLGAVLTPANPAYTQAEVRSQLEGSRARAVVAHPSTLERVLGAARELSAVHTVACTGSSADLPPFAVGAGVAALDDWRHGAALVTRTAACVRGSSLALLPYSSGTTGLPKGTMLSHANLTSNMQQFIAPEGRFIPDGAPVICPLPQYHIYAFTLAVLFMLWRGHPLVTSTRFELATFCRQVRAYRPARAYLVPPILLALVKSEETARVDWSSLQMITSAAAPLDAELERACALRLGCRVKQAWGMSELSPLGTWPADDAVRDSLVGSVGPPVPSTLVRVVELHSAESGEGEGDEQIVDVPHGAEGELLVSGPQVMLGYLDNAEATARTLVRAADGTTWLRTGDVARVDEGGFIWITDRAKELIKFKGFQVAPAELEAVLLTHPDVLDAAVIPLADAEGGEVPRAYVVLREAHSARAPRAEANAIVDWVAGRMAPHKRLRGGVKLTDKIPKSASGKILRRLVRDADRREEAALRHREHEQPDMA